MSEYAGTIRAVAQELLGEPNTRHSSAHEWRYGTHGSLSIDLNKDVWHDKEANEGGGAVDLVMRQTGLPKGGARAWMVERGLLENKALEEVAYDYVSPDGELLYQVIRKPGHKFIQRRPGANGEWIYKLDKVERVLYRLPELLASEDAAVYLVEGEKDVDNLRALGLTATTSSGGAKNWRDHYAQPLAGRRVIILPDNDEEGNHYAQTAAASLQKVGATVSIVELPGLPKKGDVSDWLADGGTREQLEELCARSAPEPVAQVAMLQRVSLNLHRQPSEWPHVIEAYFPRRVITLLGGHGGAGKSMLALILASHVAAGRPWGPLTVEQGRVVFLSFEDDRDEVERRAARIVEAYALPHDEVLTNLEVFDGSDLETELCVEAQGGGLDFTPLMEAVTEAAKGADIVIIDNASDTFGGNENERRQVRRFIRRLARDAKANNASVVLLAHIDKQAAKGGGKGNNYSGSTQWHNSVRSRLALVESDEDGIQVLHEKANYGRRHEPVTLLRSEWGVLSPVAAAEAQASRQAAKAILTQNDMADVLGVVEALLSNEIDIPTADTGQRTAYHVLSRAPEFPPSLKGTAGKERTKAALMALQRDGRIVRETYRTASRKYSERWTLAHFPRQEAA